MKYNECWKLTIIISFENNNAQYISLPVNQMLKKDAIKPFMIAYCSVGEEFFTFKIP